MEDHETRRKIIREWMALPTDKRQTAEQAAAFAKKAIQQNEFHRSRRDPSRISGNGEFWRGYPAEITPLYRPTMQVLPTHMLIARRRLGHVLAYGKANGAQ